MQVSTRSSPMHAFPVHYPQVIGMPNSAADELGSVANVQQNKPYTSTRTHLIWTGSTEVAPADVEQVFIEYGCAVPLCGCKVWVFWKFRPLFLEGVNRMLAQ